MSFDHARSAPSQDVLAPRREFRGTGCSHRPCSGHFEKVIEQLSATLYDGGIAFEDAVEEAVVFCGQLTLYVARRYLVVVAGVLRDDPRLRFELCLGVSGVHYPADIGRELHSVYLLMSIAHNWRIQLEVAVPDVDLHVPSLFPVYPAADWYEREAYKLFGIVFDGHPSPSRIETSGDWRGYPQRLGYLSGQDPGAVPSLTDIRGRGPDDIRLVTERPLMPGEQGVGSDCALTDGETDGGQIATTATGGNHQRYVVSADTQRRSAQVMALIVEIDGKIVTYARCGIELLHSTIEKSLEHHSLTQCLTFVSQMDKVSPLFNEAAYCLGVERLMGIIEVVPVRANVIRILLMELNRIASHLLGLTTGGVELAALTAMRLFGLRERVLSVFNTITGARMNQAYIRPGGLARDLPGEAISQIRDLLKLLPKRLEDMENRLKEDSLWKARTQGIGYFDLSMCIALGVTGPLLRSAGLPHDLRRAQPYCGYETYEFEVMTDTAGDVYSRYLIRVKEIQESLRIVEQCLDRLRPGPIVADHPKLAWLTHLALGPDDFGDSRKHLARIMGTSMEALIHHLNEDVRVPAGQVYVAVESPCGELGVHVVSDGGSQPYRVHYRDPSFTNLQAFAAICEGATIADVIAAIPSIDPLMRVADEDAGRG